MTLCWGKSLAVWQIYGILGIYGILQLIWEKNLHQMYIVEHVLNIHDIWHWHNLELYFTITSILQQINLI